MVGCPEEPLGHERFGGPKLGRFVILGSEESESKTRAAGCSPVVGGGRRGKIRVLAPHQVLVAGLTFVGRGFRALRLAQWPPPMTAHPGAQCALSRWPRTAPPFLLHNGGTAVPSRPFFATLPPGSLGPVELERVRLGSRGRLHSLGGLALIRSVMGAGSEDRSGLLSPLVCGTQNVLLNARCHPWPPGPLGGMGWGDVLFFPSYAFWVLRGSF